ncbi:methyltransferase domain-containing protein [Gemella cuniculi]|uniref:methyltransferase domain-containing protein n=1 Tax=Gemella cuniculi TaxID=150240 RepID=UPI00040A835C|nr:methyltransferase domain-containing protein [Gemella cuniculi]
MRIENVINKFNQEKIYLCPKCMSNAEIKNISLTCGEKHSYDFSKKGYLHLINNYRKTKYNEELFLARGIIFKNNFYKKVLECLGELISKYSKDIVVDIGCGEGYYIKELKRLFPEKYFYGLDNSKDAIELATKDDKRNPYIIANLAKLPFRSNSISCILNILTPANYNEFFRVLGDRGYLIKIIPNSNYLREIRSITKNKTYTNDDTIKLIEDNCKIVERIKIYETYQLDEYLAEQFLKMTPLTFSKDISVDDIKNLKTITIDLEILVCKK